MSPQLGTRLSERSSPSANNETVQSRANQFGSDTEKGTNVLDLVEECVLLLKPVLLFYSFFVFCFKVHNQSGCTVSACLKCCWAWTQGFSLNWSYRFNVSAASVDVVVTDLDTERKRPKGSA